MEQLPKRDAMRQPPCFARWVLERFIPQETLVGDVMEGYASGRSQTWYWKQIVSGVVRAWLSELMNGRLLTVRAIAMGSAVAVGAVIGWDILLRSFPIGGVSELNLRVREHDPGAMAIGYFAAFWGFFISAWTVGRFHQTSMVFAFLGCLLVGSALRPLGLTPEWLPSALQPEGWGAGVAAVAVCSSVLVRRHCGFRSR